MGLSRCEDYDEFKGSHDIGLLSHPLPSGGTISPPSPVVTSASTPSHRSPPAPSPPPAVMPPPAAVAAVEECVLVPRADCDSESDDEECDECCDGYEAGTGMDSFSDVGELPDTEVVYVREGVAVWPQRNQRIMGRLSLVQQHRVLFLSWIPYRPGSLRQDGSFQESPEAELGTADRHLYALHPIPLSDVKAVRKHAPKWGWQHIVLVLSNGLTLPPFYFGNGGVKTLFSALKEHTHLAKCVEDANTYLVNDISDPLQRSLTSLQLTDVLLGAPPPGACSTYAPPGMSAGGGGWATDDGGPRGALMASVMEHLTRGASAMSQIARDGASGFFAGGSLAEPGGLECALNTEHRSMGKPPVMDQSLVLGPVPPSGHINLLPDKILHVRELEAATSVGVFEMIDRSDAPTLARARSGVRPPPISAHEFESFFSLDGKLDNKAFRKRVYESGIEPAARPEAWKFLLGVHPADSTAEQRRGSENRRLTQYQALKAQWETVGDAQAARFAKWRERRTRVDKDVRRTDRSQAFFAGARNPHVKTLRRILLTYSMYNFDLSYCQGMSDLCAPILAVVRDEAETFWCFAALMDRLEGNFNTDCTGMHTQLGALSDLMRLLDPQLASYLAERGADNYFYCYRWLLIHFKREFAFDDLLRFWEALWSQHPSPQLHIFCAAAILERHRRTIMERNLDFDGLLRFCIQLSGKIDLDSMLRDAEKLCHHAGEAGQECVAGLP